MTSTVQSSQSPSFLFSASRVYRQTTPSSETEIHSWKTIIFDLYVTHFKKYWNSILRKEGRKTKKWVEIVWRENSNPDNFDEDKITGGLCYFRKTKVEVYWIAFVSIGYCSSSEFILRQQSICLSNICG